MEADLNEHFFKSTLLVPKRDVKNELWHGPRSGFDGTTWLTGQILLSRLKKESCLNSFSFERYILAEMASSELLQNKLNNIQTNILMVQHILK